METKKVLTFIFSLLFFGAFTFVLCWGIINFNKVKDGMSGTGVYTQEDINKSYQDGYDTALTNKEEYDELINSYRDNITAMTDTISQLNSDKNGLQNNIRDYQTQVNNLTTLKNQNETLITLLSKQIDGHYIDINNLNSQIVSLNNQINNLTNSNEDKSEEIINLSNQITLLQNLSSQLQTTNELNLATIETLNLQVASLNTQISNIFLQLQDNSNNVVVLNSRINELQNSIAYYENYIASLATGTQVIATFEFNGSVYNIQVVNKNSSISVVNPTSTDYVIFNGWKVNNNLIDLNTYTIIENTKFVADCTYNYDVIFKVDNENYNTQIITKGTTATLPTAPTKSGYQFIGWTLNNVDIVDVSNITINANTTFSAKFVQQHSVSFISEEETISTQLVNNGTYATAPTITSTDYKVFNGWKLNGTIVDLSTYKVYGAVNFVADYTYKYDVIFKVDNENYNTQIITQGTTATIPTTPTNGVRQFVGWSVNKLDVVDISNISINSNTIFYAVFFDIGFTTLSEKTWNGLTDFCGVDVWTDGENIYYSGGSSEEQQYVLNKETSTWERKTWYGFVIPVYSIEHDLNGRHIWTDGENIYFSNAIAHFVLNKETSTWEPKTWNGFTNFSGENIWFDGENIYCSTSATNHYVLNKETSTWERKTWYGTLSFRSDKVWTDGENFYYSNSTTHAVLNKETSTWEPKTWNGLAKFISDRVWTDGENIYYSSGTNHYVLNKETSTWEPKTWNGFAFSSGADVWTDGENFYYSSNGFNYQFS